jgi:hypothetical protein
MFVYYPPPTFFRVFQETVNVDVIYQLSTNNGDHIREKPTTFHSASDRHKQKTGEHGYPNLYFYGILIVSEEIFRRRILFELFEKQLFANVFVHQCYFFGFYYQIVGNKLEQSFVFRIPIGYSAT